MVPASIPTHVATALATVPSVHAASSPRATASAIASAVGSPASGLSSQELYTTLLTSTLPANLLPDGFSKPKTGQGMLTDADMRHHGVGSVEINLTGPDPQDAIGYTVYATPADALARFKEPPQLTSAEKLMSDGPAPGFSQPALLTSGSVTGKNAFGATVVNGFTGCYVLVGNVIVAGATTSTDNDSSGNIPAAISLVKAGIQFLRAAEGQH